MAKGLAALVLAMLIVPALIRAPDAAELLPDKPELIGRLERGDFEALDQRLAAFQEAFERGEISDTLVDYAFSTFMNSDLELEDRLGAWNEAMPGSFAAAAARGRYYWHLGWLTRDQSVAARTRRLALARMRGYFDLAEADFEQAIAERSGFSMAYGYLIDMAAARGDEVARAVALEPPAKRFLDRIEAAGLDGTKVHPKSVIDPATLSDRPRTAVGATWSPQRSRMFGTLAAEAPAPGAARSGNAIMSASHRRRPAGG